MTIAEAYEKANVVKPEHTITPLTFEEAKKAVKKMWRHLTGETFHLPIVETSGNRYTWPHSGTFRVNCEKGWDDLIHLFSHWYYQKTNHGRPHSKKHARIEKNLRKWAVKLGWMNGSLKKEEAVQETNPVHDKAEKAKKMMDKWTRKLKLAKTMLRKWTLKAKYYDKKASPTIEVG